MQHPDEKSLEGFWREFCPPVDPEPGRVEDVLGEPAAWTGDVEGSPDVQGEQHVFTRLVLAQEAAESFLFRVFSSVDVRDGVFEDAL